MADEHVLENNIYEVKVINVDYPETNELTNDVREWLYWELSVNLDKSGRAIIMVLEINNSNVFAITASKNINNETYEAFLSTRYDIKENLNGYAKIKDYLSKQGEIIYLVDEIILNEKDT